jgi:phenylpropionate dioxygenase-like ring-hydroxylating dioxygenase large terminal subunit
MWISLLSAKDLPAGDVRVVEHGDTDILIFRTKAGALHAIEAWCPHMRNYIPSGVAPGQDLNCLLHGEHIECPFHNWRFDSSGRCIAVPLGQRMPARVAAATRLMQTWEVRENDGNIELGNTIPPDPD